MKRSIEELESIVRSRICGVCTDRTEEGDCGREDPASCSLFRRFPQVAAAIQSVSSNDIRDYVDAIRHQVCSICVAQSPDGDCELRQQVQCALDAYLILIVEIIEEATGKTFDRSPLVAVDVPVAV